MTIILIGALIIGFTLGLLGSGGSAITVPVLVYLVGHEAKQSIAESMAIVGLISVVAAIPYARARNVDWRSVLYFGIPGMLGTFIGAWLGGVSAAALQLAVFGAVLVAAAVMMFRPPNLSVGEAHLAPIWKVAVEGTIVGVVTGFVGVGGGFLIVPALVLMAKLPMRLAIGTSLVIIAIKAAVGFAKYEHYLLAHDMSVDLNTVLLFVAMGIVGSWVGKSVNARMNQQVLRRAFAVFLVLLGCFVIVREGGKMLHSEKPHVADTVATSQSVLN
ncbi:MAG: sulfite exporter TauE/SafE family protein [Planctomycetales bacterium]|nr:sulfite exporter TauE/SafE family protein [Planctomycetales bacterium]